MAIAGAILRIDEKIIKRPMDRQAKKKTRSKTNGLVYAGL